jgi:hypothetical protein
LSLLCLVGAITGGPIVLPAIGLALGANAMLREYRLTERNPIVRYLGILGVVGNGLVVLLVIFDRSP